ncbi:Gfo/Idh/MocA family protein [Microlunatus antarcticus]|uniref:Myo-inositol 2-dehydrogenase/D-chiro-inositol 1-dehydrogenase n=1 Tax=Microlunatus antarcticus TaxID=53388 RepID=A0A7W5JV62_9ACTN|nr:Gfo/Idh/MocA family oxidoreductase [Microlunatus antarcticus]MBB3326925.1 myo-inositol 2-dehydrogenase/D-chiro-inositol 1-dehydrogenase [Microlunatus antarcticus]
MRIGLIGLGRIGAFHADTLIRHDEVDELVVTDAMPGMAEAAASRLGATPVADAEALLASRLDGVVIASSTPTHLGLLRAAVAAGIPTFCEKPVAEDPYAVAGLVGEIERSGVPVQIGFPRRFDPAFVAAKAASDAGELGWLTTVRSTTMDPAPPPAAYVASSGGIFRDCAIHDFDAVRWVTGREVVEVYAVGGNRGDALFADANDVDTASTLLTFDDGTLGVVSDTRYNGQGYDVRLELHGSEGSISAGLDDGLPFRSADPTLAFPAGPAHTFFMDRFATAFQIELSTFLAVAAGRQASPCTITDGLEASWIAEAATLSLHEHRPVRLDDVRG